MWLHSRDILNTRITGSFKPKVQIKPPHPTTQASFIYFFFKKRLKSTPNEVKEIRNPSTQDV
jgi:hypothetical protein